MKNNIGEILKKIGESHRDEIDSNGRHYKEIDISEEAKKMGYPPIEVSYPSLNAVIPLKGPTKGMKVRIDGRAWVGYAQFESGVVVPGFIAKDAGLRYQDYHAQDSMIKNF